MEGVAKGFGLKREDVDNIDALRELFKELAAEITGNVVVVFAIATSGGILQDWMDIKGTVKS